jgi:hypothetical protein
MPELTRGCYRVRWEGNLIVITQVGDVAVEDLEWVLEQIQAAGEKGMSVDVLCNLHQAGSVDKHVRRRISQHPAMKFVRLVSVHGMSISLRAVATLAMRAILLLGAIKLNVSLHGTESAARAWLDEERSRLRS